MLTSQFSTGLLLDGTHKSIKLHGGKLCHLAYNLTRGVVKMPSPDIGMELSKPKLEQDVAEEPQKKLVNLNHCMQFNFLEAEELGVGQPGRCGMCQL